MLFKDFFNFPLFWYLKVVLSCLTSASIGSTLVQTLRQLCKQTPTHKIWKLALSVFITPISVFIVLHLASSFKMCDRVVADAFSFGVVIGILIKLKSKPTGKATIKLIAQNIATGKRTDVWLDSLDVLVGDARNRIAESLNKSPANRISIETGKGKFIDDLKSKLIPAISFPSSSSLSLSLSSSSSSSAVFTSDFFGFITITCYIHIKEEEGDMGGGVEHFHNNSITTSNNNNNNNNNNNPNNLFRSLLNTKGEARYGEPLILTAKIPNKTSDTKSFYISPVDKFVAAAPGTSSQHCPVQIICWNKANAAYASAEGLSENGDHVNVNVNITGSPLSPSSPSSPVGNGVSKGGGGGGGGGLFGNKKTSSIHNISNNSNNNTDSDVYSDNNISNGNGSSNNNISNGNSSSNNNYNKNNNNNNDYDHENIERQIQNNVGHAVRNGDLVVIECDGKFMSVTRGWWMAWSSGAPRRSGAFIIEIIEKAPQNIVAAHLKEQFETIKEKIGLQQGNTNTNASSNRRDNILKTGDSFRLRSVKFPEFELGITSVKLRDEYCYLGLRKVLTSVPSSPSPSGPSPSILPPSSPSSPSSSSNNDSSWCLEVRFSVKMNSLSTEINKIAKRTSINGHMR